MAETTPLGARIKAEFDAQSQRAKTTEQEQARNAEERESRLAQFGKACDDLAGVWRPRIEEFAKQFGDRIKVTPTVTPAMREARAVFLTDMASMTLTLTVAPDLEVRNLVLDHDLLIVPMYIEYDRHARLEMPLDKIDRDAVGTWIDDRLISCVKAYLAMQENKLYQERAMVEDPITKTRFMPDKAAATLEHNNRTVHFASQESLREYKRLHELEPKPVVGDGKESPAAKGGDAAAPPAKGDGPRR